MYSSRINYISESCQFVIENTKQKVDVTYIRTFHHSIQFCNKGTVVLVMSAEFGKLFVSNREATDILIINLAHGDAKPLIYSTNIYTESFTRTILALYYEDLEAFPTVGVDE